MRIAFVGDISVGAGAETLVSAATPDLHDLLDVEMVVGNFEAVADGSATGTSHPGKICLSTSSDVPGALKAMGIDAVSVANNHSADFGSDAARRSIDRLVEVFGEDRVFGWGGQPSVLLMPGLRVVGACFPETSPLTSNEPTGVPEVTSAADVVRPHRHEDERLIVYAHWGEEHVSLAEPVLRSRAREMVEAGASQIVGCHSHVIGPGEDIGSTTVLYSLGNFLFRSIPETNARMLRRNRRGLVAVYECDGDGVRHVECWRSTFDTRYSLKLVKLKRRLPGGTFSTAHLRLSPRLSGVVFEAALRTRPLRLGFAKVATGVERPTPGKLKTALRLTSTLGRSRTHVPGDDVDGSVSGSSTEV